MRKLRFSIRELMLITAFVAAIAGWLWWRSISIRAESGYPASDWNNDYRRPEFEAGYYDEWVKKHPQGGFKRPQNEAAKPK